MAEAVACSVSEDPLRRYALIDLARAPQVLPLLDWLTRSGAAQCLFEGAIAEPLRRVSPHIVDLARAPQLLDRWLAEGRGQSWGVFIETALPMHLARRHVRRFLQVRLPDGTGPVLMRFWDPRVLSVLLRHADAAQHGAIFARLTRVIVERDESRLNVFAVGGHRAASDWETLARFVAQ